MLYLFGFTPVGLLYAFHQVHRWRSKKSKRSILEQVFSLDYYFKTFKVVELRKVYSTHDRLRTLPRHLFCGLQGPRTPISWNPDALSDGGLVICSVGWPRHCSHLLKLISFHSVLSVGGSDSENISIELENQK